MLQGNSRGDVPGLGSTDTIEAKVKATRSSNQAIPTGLARTDMALTGTDEFDTDSLHDTATNPQSIIGIDPNRLGVLQSFIEYAANATGERGAEFISVSEFQRGVIATPASVSNTTKLTAITIGGPGGVGSSVDAVTYQTSGGNLNLAKQSYSFCKIRYSSSSPGFANSRGDVTGLNIGTNPTLAKAISTAVQSIPNAAYTLVTYTGVEFDTGSFWSSGSPNRLTIPTTGKYILLFGGIFAVNVTGDRGIDFAVNGTRIAEGELVAAVTTGSTAQYMQASCSKSLTAGDYVEAYVYQNRGGSLNLGIGQWETGLIAYLVP